MDCPEVLVVMLRPQWLHVRFLSPAVPSLQTSSRDVGRTSSFESDLPQSITPGTDDPAELEEPPESAGLPPDELGALGELAAEAEDELGALGELAAEAEDGAELGVAEAPEPVEWHAVMKAGPRTAQMASNI